MTEFQKRFNAKWSAILTAAIIALTGCNPSIPDPTSPEVIQLAESLSMQIVRNAVLIETAQNKTGISAERLQQYGYPELDFEVWSATRESSDTINAVVEAVEEVVDGLDNRIENIRVESKDIHNGKVICVGQLESNRGTTLDIRFSAQYTEDNRLWVEVELIQ